MRSFRGVMTMPLPELADEREQLRNRLAAGDMSALVRYGDVCAEPARRSAQWTPEWAERRRHVGLDGGERP